MEQPAPTPTVHHALGQAACPRCAPGYPKTCDCGGFVHAEPKGWGAVVTRCDRCLAAAPASKFLDKP